MYTNADCLCNKRDELTALINERKPDIIAITEVLPKNRSQSAYSDVEWHLDGYTSFYPDFNNYEGRGCIIYTKESLQAYCVELTGFNQIEQITIGLCCANNMKLLISCIYRSPNKTNQECISDLADLLNLTHFGNIHYDLRLIIGDFNMKEIDWDTSTTSTSEQHISTQFLEIVRDSFLTQHVKEPTRYREHETPSILDLILTNEEGMIDNIEHNAPLGKSDHEILTFNLRCGSTNRENNQKRRKYFKGDYLEINKYLSTTDWMSILSEGTVDETWNSLADKIQIAVREYIPESKPSTRKFNTPWMDSETLYKVKRKRKLWKKYKYCRSPNNKEKYDEAKEIASNSVKAAKRRYEKQIALNMKDDSKLFWKFVQSKTKIKEDIQCIIDDSGEIHSDNHKKAELLNVFFTSVFTNENEENMPAFRERTDTNLDNINVDENAVEKLLRQVKETKSHGPDGIHPKFIKETSKSLSKPVSILFKKSLEEGHLPTAWKEANITPIHKKGPKHQVGNYRPISLTSILCKILERLIRDEIMDHMESNSLFTKHQHGFRKGHSCVTQLIEVIKDWTNELDQHNNVDAIYLDFQKAFDTVPHKRLLRKLQGYGISGSLLRWLESFLVGRKQKVVLNGEESDWTNVTSGIPQGSVLGPILFLIYINDLPDVVNNIVKLFADDTKIYAKVNTKEQEENLQSDIDNLMEWSNNWQLKFNKSKCKHLHIGRNNNAIYKIGEEIIETTTEERDLGVVIDSQLKFQKHIGLQVKKANKILGLIKPNLHDMF